MTADCCQGCRFWLVDQDTVDPNDPSFSFGRCRRVAPVLLDSVVAAQIEPPRYDEQASLEPDTLDDVRASRWPATFAQNWCGQFEAPQPKVPL